MYLVRRWTARRPKVTKALEVLLLFETIQRKEGEGDLTTDLHSYTVQTKKELTPPSTLAISEESGPCRRIPFFIFLRTHLVTNNNDTVADNEIIMTDKEFTQL